MQIPSSSSSSSIRPLLKRRATYPGRMEKGGWSSVGSACISPPTDDDDVAYPIKANGKIPHPPSLPSSSLFPFATFLLCAYVMPSSPVRPKKAATSSSDSKNPSARKGKFILFEAVWRGGELPMACIGAEFLFLE